MTQSRARISVELRLELQVADKSRVTAGEGAGEVGDVPVALGWVLPPDTATERVRRRLQLRFYCSQESSSSTRVDHPCYPKDYNETVSLSSFHTSPCTNQSDPRLALGDRNVTLEGRGDASGCLAAVKKLFNFSACGQRQDCTFDGIYQPPVSGQFIVRQIPSCHLPSRACPQLLWCPHVPHGTVTSLQQKQGKKLPNDHCPRTHWGLLVSGFPASSPKMGSS